MFSCVCQVTGDTARLISPIFQASSQAPFCTFKLFYHMYGHGVGTLNVYTRTSINGHLTRRWSHNQEVGNFWVSATIPIYSQQPFQVGKSKERTSKEHSLTQGH
jgi:hypothetical protein